MISQALLEVHKRDNGYYEMRTHSPTLPTMHQLICVHQHGQEGKRENSLLDFILLDLRCGLRMIIIKELDFIPKWQLYTAAQSFISAHK